LNRDITNVTNYDPPTQDEIDEWIAEIENQQANWDPLDLPESQEQLVKDLKAAGAPKDMISKTGAGLYHDYVSPHPMPKHLLVGDAKAAGLDEIAHRAKSGHYDP
jgi:hypothetical protein